MSDSFNTDGAVVHPPHSKPTVNALDSIERAIAFHVRDWSLYNRDTWIYAIVFGWSDEAERELSEQHGWDAEDWERAHELHRQWEQAKELLSRTIEKEEQD